jgi:PKD repeat protein
MSMRTSILVIGTAALTALAGCTVKDVDAPAFSGPSTLAYSISLEANTDTLTQDGVSSAQIRIRARDHNGAEVTGRPLRAAIYVDGSAQDFGALNTKTPVTGQVLVYTAPPASQLAAAQTATTVTIAVTPSDSGDFRSEVARQVDIRLVPQGVILPTNPSLAPAFTFTPASPTVMQTVSLTAATTTNNGSACNDQCTYSWNFGDGTSGSGMAVTHEWRTAGNVQVRLTVTDNRGAQATSIQTITIAPGALPTLPGGILISPTAASAGQDIFFNASGATVVPPRRIVSYAWNFGDGGTASGVTTTHRFTVAGTYVVVLTITDDAGTSANFTLNVSVSDGLPTVSATATGLKVNQTTQLIITATPAAGATIAEYRVNWGDGSAEDVGTLSTQSHRYTTATNFTIVVTVTDSLGRKKQATVAVTIAP